jgi:CRP/FNR family transcriptional regulator, cyclic AMP receptor protein
MKPEAMSIGERAAIIASCLGCSDVCALHLGDCMAEQGHPNRAAIAYNGDPADHLFIVTDGAVLAEQFGLDGQHVQISRYGPGEVFGAYPAPAVFRTDMVASGTTRLLTISTLRLVEMASDQPEIGAGLARLFARQLDLMLDRLSSRIGLSASGRFYRALMELADADGNIRPAPVIAALALSVHTTRETASRALATLLRRGIIERNGDSLHIVSSRMLEDLIV